MKRLTVTNDITSWKSSLIGKTLRRCLYVYVLFLFCSKVKRTKAPDGAMVVEILMEGRSEKESGRSKIGNLAVLQSNTTVHTACELKIVSRNHRRKAGLAHQCLQRLKHV